MFKRCRNCTTAWEGRDAFLCDPGLELIGIQAREGDAASGLFLFTHLHTPAGAPCGTTLAIRVDALLDLVEDPRPEPLRARQPGCPLHCTRIHDLRLCDQPCRNAPFRALAVRLQERFDALRRGESPDTPFPS